MQNIANYIGALCLSFYPEKEQKRAQMMKIPENNLFHKKLNLHLNLVHKELRVYVNIECLNSGFLKRKLKMRINGIETRQPSTWTERPCLGCNVTFAFKREMWKF